MSTIKDLLEQRKERKRRMPDFVMQDSHKHKKLKMHWRKPRGIDSKIRLNLRGYNKAVEIGYGSPKPVKFMDKSGLMPVVVGDIRGLLKVNKEREGIIIASSVGKKKRVGIIAKAKELGIKILNIKDADKYAQSVQDELKARKEEKAKREKRKEERKKEEKTKKEDKLADKVLSEEEKAAQEKKEKDKLLTQKQI
jgi:large subunit ribosomal protein L32e